MLKFFLKYIIIKKERDDNIARKAILDLCYYINILPEHGVLEGQAWASFLFIGNPALEL